MGDSSDKMDDASISSEDTLMDCEGDGGGLDRLADLVADIVECSSTFGDAVEMMMALVDVDNMQQCMLSSSDDEGIEVDVGETDEPQNTRLLQYLAASVALDRIYRQQKQSAGSTRTTSSRGRYQDYAAQGMETSQDVNSQHDQTSTDPEHYHHDVNQEKVLGRAKFLGNFHKDFSNDGTKTSAGPDVSRANFLNKRLRMEDDDEVEDDDDDDEVDDDDEDDEDRDLRCEDSLPASWAAGWDACATEALRYLVEEGGLSPHHPTVIAMKNHLDLPIRARKMLKKGLD